MIWRIRCESPQSDRLVDWQTQPVASPIEIFIVNGGITRFRGLKRTLAFQTNFSLADFRRKLKIINVKTYIELAGGCLVETALQYHWRERWQHHVKLAFHEEQATSRRRQVQVHYYIFILCIT